MFSRAPGSIVLCAIVIGVWVAPGPWCPAMSPAIRRTSAPPSSEDSSRTCAALDGLVPRCRELVLARQVHPQLDAVEHPAAFDQFGGRSLDVQDSRPCGHPLRGAVGDQATAAVGVLMGESPVEHVRHGFEPAVRMPVGASWLARLVLDLAHLVHMHERIEVGGADSGEGAHDGKALALIASRAGGDGADGSLGVRRARRGDARQSQGVSGDSRHASGNRTAVRFIPGRFLREQRKRPDTPHIGATLRLLAQAQPRMASAAARASAALRWRARRRPRRGTAAA